MAVMQHRAPGESAPRRRARFLLRSAALLLSVAIAGIAATVLAERYAPRLDLTGARRLTLAPRTLTILSSLTGPTEIVIAADPGRVDRRARQRLEDLLDEFRRAAPALSVSWINPTDAAGRVEFARVLGEQATREGGEIDRHTAALDAATAGLPELLTAMSEAAEGVRAASAALDPFEPRRAELENSAAILKAQSAALEPLIESARVARASSAEGVALPTADVFHAQASAPLNDAARLADAVAKAFARAGTSETPNPTAAAAARARDKALAILEAFSSLRPLRALAVARVLRATDAALVIGPEGISAVRLETLFPASAEGGPDPLFAGEPVLASALDSLSGRPGPALVLVHAEGAPLLGPSGEPTTTGRRVIGRSLDRLALDRWSLHEWAAALQPAPPRGAALDPTGPGGVVWLIFPAPSRAATEVGGSAGNRIERLGKLAAAVRTLITDQASLMISLDPSDLPGTGEPDPIAQALAELGVRAETSKPLVRVDSTPTGPVVSTAMQPLASSDGHPVSSLLAGLSGVFPWSIAMEAAVPAPMGARFLPLLTVPARGEVWGESQWLAYRYASAQQPLAPFQMADPPARNPGRDLTAGPWTIAAAVERTLADRPERPQRAVIVGSPSWFDDYFTQASAEVDGQAARLFPMNEELFHQGLTWLAHQDDQLARGQPASAIARIPALSERQLLLARLLLMVGMPLGVLAIGVTYRLLRP